ERRIGKSAFSEISINCTVFYGATWAKTKGFYAEVFETTEELDKAVYDLAGNLSLYSPEAMTEMKKMYWRGTENWDTLLHQQAVISGRLVLSEFTKNKLEKYK